jgi:hypothetical protein
MAANPGYAPPTGPPPGGQDPGEPGVPSGDPPDTPSDNGGEPVDLATGLFVYNKTDLVLPDVLPVALKRTYRQNDSASRAFGIGFSNLLDIFLVGNINPYTYLDLIFPDGGRIRYNRTSSGTGFEGAVYVHSGTSTGFYGSTIAWNDPCFCWILNFKNGTIYHFPEA